MAYYPFNGNTDDESGNGNNGSIVGSISVTNNVLGDVGQAYHFNGSSFISVPHKPELAIKENGGFSVCIWVKAAAVSGNHLIGIRSGQSYNWQIALDLNSSNWRLS